MELLLVSEDKVRNVSQGCAPVRLFLRRVRLKNMDYYPQYLYISYDHIELQEGSNSWLHDLNFQLIREHIVMITFDVIFVKPPQVAVAMCGTKRVNRSGLSSVFRSADPSLHALPDANYFTVLANTTSPWNISNVYTIALITVVASVDKIPTTLLKHLAFTPIRHVSFYRCSFHKISFNDIPLMKSIYDFEFLESPIETIHPDAFDLLSSS
ncbi:hypothetical protein HPB48_018159 [Haemaphysalis longicornis]|uniref:Uncharacterized protein n=1 Tax=Haemaphysalis longicornis TaxID=44386 RepID=A0A9J6FV37_HAELO|nr:hypothetical protein HPB48_018159 [Haemaphysalis longicornis]